VIDALAEYRTSPEPIIYCSTLYNVIIAGSYPPSLSPHFLSSFLSASRRCRGGQANESAYRLVLIEADFEAFAAIMKMYVSTFIART